MVMPNLFTGPGGIPPGIDPNQFARTLAQILTMEEREDLRRSGNWETIQREGFAARQSDRRRQEEAWRQQVLDRERASKIQAMGAGPGVRFGGNIGATLEAQQQQQRRARRPRTAMGAQPGVGIIGFQRPQERQSRFAQAQEPPGHTALREDMSGSTDLASAQAIANEYVDAGRITSGGASRILRERFDPGAMQPPGQFRPGIFGEDPAYDIDALRALGEVTDVGAGFIRNPLGFTSRLFGMGLDEKLGFRPGAAIREWGELGRSPSGINVNLPFIGEVDIVREAARLVGDPLNLLPGVGFAPDIARLIRTGRLGQTAARTAAADAAQRAATTVPPVRPQIPIPPRPTAEALRAQAEAAGAAVSTYPTPAIQRAPTPPPIPTAPPVAAAVEPAPLIPRAAPTAGELMDQTPAIRQVPRAVEEVVEEPAMAGGAGLFEMETVIPVQKVAPENIPTRGPALTQVREQAEAAGEKVAAGIVQALDQATTIWRSDASPLARHIPSLGPHLLGEPGGILAQTRALITPIRGITQRIGETNIAAFGTRARILTRASATRQPLVDEANRLFGSDVVLGNARSDIARNFESVTNPFQRQAAERLSGSILHIFEHPQLYDLNPTQRAFIRELNTRNDDLLNLVRGSFGVELGQVQVPDGAAFLKHIETQPAAVLEAQVKAAAADTQYFAGQSSRARVHLTAQDRLAGELRRISEGADIPPDELFQPSVNLSEILGVMDAEKSALASAEVLRAGLGGQTKMDLVAPRYPGLVAQDRVLRTRLRELQGLINGVSAERDEALQVFFGSAADPEDYATLAAALGRPLRTSADTAEAAARGLNLPRLNAEMNSIQAELRQVGGNLQNARPRPGFVRVGGGVNKYFPAEEAKQLQELFKTGNNPLVKVLTEINATVLAGDLSPFIGVQGALFFLFHPWLATKRLYGMGTGAARARDPFHAFRAKHLAEQIRANPEAAEQFAFYFGRPLAPGHALPQEFSPGLLSRLPTVFGKDLGKLYTQGTEGMFSAQLSNMMASFEQLAETSIRAGASRDEAYAAASDIVSKMIPLLNRSRLGESAATATARRAPFTSIAFLRQPVALMNEASVGLVKLGLRQPLTPKEQLAVRVMTTMAGTVAFLAGTSAATDALMTGKPVDQAVLKALREMKLIFPGTGTSIPLGGPFRSFIRAVLPKDIEVSGIGKVPVPFAGIPSWLLNRATPGIEVPAELLKNRETFTRRRIVTGDFPMNVVQGLTHTVTGGLPLTAQSVTRGVFAGESASDILVQSAGEFLGSSVRLRSPSEEEIEIYRGAWTRVPEGERHLEAAPGGFDDFRRQPAGREILMEYTTPEENEALARIDREQVEEATAQIGGEDAEAVAIVTAATARAAIRTLVEDDPNILPREFRTGADRIQRDARAVIEAFPPDFPAGKTEGQKNIERYFDAFDEADAAETPERPASEIIDELHGALFAEIGPDHTALLLENIYAVTDPNAPGLYVELRDLRLNLAQSGFYEIRPRAWEVAKVSNPGMAEFATYGAWYRHKIDQLVTSLEPEFKGQAFEEAVEMIVKFKVYKDFMLVRGGMQKEWVGDHAIDGLAEQASKFGYLNLSSERNEEQIVASGRRIREARQ